MVIFFNSQARELTTCTSSLPHYLYIDSGEVFTATSLTNDVIVYNGTGCYVN